MIVPCRTNVEVFLWVNGELLKREVGGFGSGLAILTLLGRLRHGPTRCSQFWWPA